MDISKTEERVWAKEKQCDDQENPEIKEEFALVFVMVEFRDQEHSDDHAQENKCINN